MFRIALNAGHYLNTAGKRCLKGLDANETREWVLNSRICERVEQKLREYEGCELLRIDDREGKRDLSVRQRTDKANAFGADIYISVHHNAGIAGGDGGGIMAFVYTDVGEPTLNLQRLLYGKLIEKTGLAGNRSQPMSRANFGECKFTKMPAVLLECGFMDSASDVPVILSEGFADKCAEAIAEAAAEYGKLNKKAAAEPSNTDKMYYVQVGAYKNRANAENMAKKLKAAGFNAIIK